MARPYLTMEQYCLKYDVPRSTVRYWIQQGVLEVRKDVRPMLIPDGQGIPYKDPDIHKFRYQWKRQ